MYGIYQIGYTIEDPFQGSLRLTILSEAIFRDVMHGSAFMDRRLTAFEGGWGEAINDEESPESATLPPEGDFRP